MTAPRALPRRRSVGGSRRWRVFAIGTLTAVLLGAGTLPAQAHDALVDTVPLDTEVLTAAPAAVELTFTGQPLPLGTEVLVVGPDGSAASTGAAEIRGTTVLQPLAEGLPAGSYRVEWRSTSSDGHRLTGSLAFTIAAGSGADGTPAAGTTVTPEPQSAATTADETADADADADAGWSNGWLFAAGVALAALGVLLVLRLRRRA